MFDAMHLLGEQNRTRTVFAVLFAALLVSGCDGGIFGTGDSNSDIPISTTQPGNSSPLDNEESPSQSPGQESIGEGGVEATEAPGGSVDDTDAQTEGADVIGAPELSPEDMDNEPQETITFENTLAGYSGVEPQLRFVNASQDTIRVSLDRATGDAEIIQILPFSVTPQAVLEIGETVIDMTTSREPAQTVRIVATLGLSSVSTVLIQPVDADSTSVSVLALETQASSNDPALAQLRLVAPAWNLPLANGQWSLTPSGSNPGSADAMLDAILDASSDPSYTIVSAGEYELRLDGESIELPTLALSAGTVRTLVLRAEMGSTQLIEVLDSDIDGEGFTSD